MRTALRWFTLFVLAAVAFLACGPSNCQMTRPQTAAVPRCPSSGPGPADPAPAADGTCAQGALRVCVNHCKPVAPLGAPCTNDLCTDGGAVCDANLACLPDPSNPSAHTCQLQRGFIRCTPPPQQGVCGFSSQCAPVDPGSTTNVCLDPSAPPSCDPALSAEANRCVAGTYCRPSSCDQRHMLQLCAGSVPQGARCDSDFASAAAGAPSGAAACLPCEPGTTCVRPPGAPPGSLGTCGFLACSGSPATCPGSLAMCYGACFDLQRDTNHCGDCATVCPATMICASGTCQCPAGQTSCGGTCVDLQNDPGHCGSCTTACDGSASCRAGVCQYTPSITVSSVPGSLTISGQHFSDVAQCAALTLAGLPAPTGTVMLPTPTCSGGAFSNLSWPYTLSNCTPTTVQNVTVTGRDPVTGRTASQQSTVVSPRCLHASPLGAHRLGQPFQFRPRATSATGQEPVPLKPTIATASGCAALLLGRLPQSTPLAPLPLALLVASALDVGADHRDDARDEHEHDDHPGEVALRLHGGWGTSPLDERFVRAVSHTPGF